MEQQQKGLWPVVELVEEQGLWQGVCTKEKEERLWPGVGLVEEQERLYPGIGPVGQKEKGLWPGLDLCSSKRGCDWVLA